MRYLVTVIQWGAASLPPSTRLREQGFVSADCGDDAFKYAEESWGNGATIIEATAQPMIAVRSSVRPLRVSERRPIYRRDPVKYHRLPLHLAGFPDDVTLCGELLDIIGPDNWTDDIEGIIEHEPKGCCAKCIALALHDVNQSAMEAA